MGSHDAEEELQIQVIELKAEVERLKAFERQDREIRSALGWKRDGRELPELVRSERAEVERQQKKYNADTGILHNRISGLEREVKRLKAKVDELLSYLHYDRETESHRDWVADCQDSDAKIDAALAEAEDTNTPDDYRKLQRVAKALRGGER